MQQAISYPSLDAIPTSIMSELPKSAILVYRELSALAKISSRDGSGQTHIVPSLRHLAARVGYSVRTIHVAIHKLKAASLIDHVHRLNFQTGKRITNLYFLARKIGIKMRLAYKHLKNVITQMNPASNKYYNTSITPVNAPPILGGGGRTGELKPFSTAPPPTWGREHPKDWIILYKTWLNRK